MPKRVFWPVTLVIMGLIFLAANMGMLPSSLWNLWPVVLIVVGLGGLVTSDREEWMEDASAPSKSSAKSAAASTKSSSKKTKSAKPAKKAGRRKTAKK